MNNYPIDHVAIAVRSIQESTKIFETITGCTCSVIEELPIQDVNVAFLGSLELIEPRSAHGVVGRFIERNGPGLHHIAYRVPDILTAIEEFKKQGFETIDDRPRLGARGHQIVFLNPKTTGSVLIELVQQP